MTGFGTDLWDSQKPTFLGDGRVEPERREAMQPHRLMPYTTGMSTPFYHNKGANALLAPVTPDEPESVLEFHRRLPRYAPTPLVEAKSLARQLGVGKLWVKDESSRIGLPSFKILGASWATHKALSRLPGMQLQLGSLESWENIADLANHMAPLRPLTLVAATDGNHGRAVAHMAALLGLEALIFVPDGMAQTRRNAIAAEGARVGPCRVAMTMQCASLRKRLVRGRRGRGGRC